MFICRTSSKFNICGLALSQYSLLIRDCRQYSMTAAEIDQYFDRALSLTKTAGEMIRENINSRKTILTKSSEIDLVTKTDQDIEKLFKDGLSDSFPTHKFIGEETVAEGVPCVLTAEPTWIIDPIDGTMNFVHGFPHCCISVGLYVSKEPVMGIIYNPTLELLYTAKKGRGAYLNGNKISVSDTKELKSSLLLMEIGTSRDEERLRTVFANQQNLTPLIRGMRMLGSAALSMGMVAAGCADLYCESGMHVWDIAAGEIIVTEAGGVVIDPSGKEIDRLSRRVLCASNMELAQELAKNLVQYYPSPRD